MVEDVVAQDYLVIGNFVSFDSIAGLANLKWKPTQSCSRNENLDCAPLSKGNVYEFRVEGLHDGTVACVALFSSFGTPIAVKLPNCAVGFALVCRVGWCFPRRW